MAQVRYLFRWPQSEGGNKVKEGPLKSCSGDPPKAVPYIVIKTKAVEIKSRAASLKESRSRREAWWKPIVLQVGDRGSFSWSERGR